MAFALIVIIGGLIVAFADELSQFCQNVWTNLTARNYLLLFTLSLFGIHYIALVGKLFATLMKHMRYIVVDVTDFFHHYPGAYDFSVLMTIFLYTYAISAFFIGLYFVLTQEKMPYRINFISATWLVMMTLMILA